MWTCDKCGNQFENEVKPCPKCSEPSPPPEAPKTPANQAQGWKPNTFGLMLIGFGVFLFINNQSKIETARKEMRNHPGYYYNSSAQTQREMDFQKPAITCISIGVMLQMAFFRKLF